MEGEIYAPKVKAWSMIDGHICPICSSKRIGVICYVKMKLICVICKHEFCLEN
jgi:hypothetical protein